MILGVLSRSGSGEIAGGFRLRVKPAMTIGGCVVGGLAEGIDMMEVPFFVYGEKELEYLRGRDTKLGAAIDRIGRIERAVNPDLFSALIESVVGQQISTKAAATVRERLFDLCGLDAERLHALTIEEVQGCGMSLRKAGYIKGIADAVVSATPENPPIFQNPLTRVSLYTTTRLLSPKVGTTALDFFENHKKFSMRNAKSRRVLRCCSGGIDLGKLAEMDDAEVIRELSALNGIGVWTAEMMLIFSLMRPDVVSYGDLGIRRGMMRLYGLEELPRAEFERYRARYSPYGTVASLYLWAISAE